MSATATHAWLQLIEGVLTFGSEVSPRGKLTRELPQHTIEVDMRRPVVRALSRKLSYQFMAAEAYWILSGSDKVADISPYNKHIAEYSDNGLSFAGAYGPMVIRQLQFVVRKLIEDRDTRQAVLTIWRENPAASKDIPCTIAMTFNIRNSKMNCHVFMRSNDVWLGTPYDVFNFSMIAHLMCAHYNECTGVSAVMMGDKLVVEPGALFLTAASSHMYKTNWNEAEELLDGVGGEYVDRQPATPSILFLNSPHLMDTLKELRDTKPGHPLRWWEEHE